MNISEIKAMTFDVFGTVVDWRGSIISEGEKVWAARGVEVDWPQFAEDWRGGYGPAMNRVRTGELPWMNIDALHRLILDQLLDSHQVSGLSEADTQELNRVWHRLNPWPGCCLRSFAPAPARHRCVFVQWKCGPAGQHGPARRAVLGLCPFCRAGQALQAGPGSVQDGGRTIGVGASPSIDGRGPQRRPESLEGGRLQDRICLSASGAWPRPENGSEP